MPTGSQGGVIKYPKADFQRSKVEINIRNYSQAYDIILLSMSSVAVMPAGSQGGAIDYPKADFKTSKIGNLLRGVTTGVHCLLRIPSHIKESINSCEACVYHNLGQNCTGGSNLLRGAGSP